MTFMGSRVNAEPAPLLLVLAMRTSVMKTPRHGLADEFFAFCGEALSRRH
jgi:hypothetical protein